MLGDPRTGLDLSQPRRISEILLTALQVYGRNGPLFIVLAGIVVVPYEVIVVLVEHGHSTVKLGTELVLALAVLAIVNPLIASFQVQALLRLGVGERPRIADITREALTVVPAVAAASIVAGIGIFVGLFCFVIPGVVLALRWAVVAQVAAAERTDWPTALRRSGQLARQNYFRILGVLVAVAIFYNVGARVIGSGNQLDTTILGILLAVVLQSFGTLITNLLYFDLRARESAPVA